MAARSDQSAPLTQQHAIVRVPSSCRDLQTRQFSLCRSLGLNGCRYTGFSIGMATQEFTTSSAGETIALGRKIAHLLVPPKLVLLRGKLGAGKTTLTKGIAEAFHAASQDDVTSPTFTLVHEYRGPDVNIYHIDLYRVDTQRQLETLGLDDLIAGNSILLIEWGEKFQRFERERDIEIAIESLGENQRIIRLKGKSLGGHPLKERQES